ncbi:MAG TPA: hypothetical protein VFW00_01470, partial [Rhodocyclaceae bacterium]|nr:hypothetical protein [Rhodocyclaceae bacterium]
LAHGESSQQLSQQLSGISVRGKLKRFRCLATLRTDEYQILQAELPAVPPDEIRQALRWSIRELVDYPVDDVGADYLEIPVNNEQMGVRAAYVVCARGTALSRYVNAFESAKAKLMVADVAETAHRNLAALCPVGDNGILLVAVMPDHCLLTFARKGELCMSRRIDVGLTALMDADENRRSELFDRILLELQRSLDGFERQFHFAPLAKIMVSPLPDDIHLLPFLVDNLYQKVESLDLATLMDFSAVPALANPAIQSAYLTLLGAGLRDETATDANTSESATAN